MRKQRRRKQSLRERAVRIARMIRRLAVVNLSEKELNMTNLYRLQDAADDVAYPLTPN